MARHSSQGPHASTVYAPPTPFVVRPPTRCRVHVVDMCVARLADLAFGAPPAARIVWLLVHERPPAAVGAKDSSELCEFVLILLDAPRRES